MFKIIVVVFVNVADGFRVFSDDTKLHTFFYSGFISFTVIIFMILSFYLIDPKTKTSNIINISLHNSRVH